MSDRPPTNNSTRSSIVSEATAQKQAEKRASKMVRIRRRINSRKNGRSSTIKQAFLSRSRLSTRKSTTQQQGISHKDGYKGRSSMLRSPSFTPKLFNIGAKFGRAASIVTRSFRSNSKILNMDDKSDTSVFRMDPIVREAYEQMKLAHHPDDLEEASIILETMNKHPTSKEIYYQGLAYLAGIATQEGEGLVQIGILDVIANAFEHFTSAPKVLESACVLVWNLGTQEKVIKDIMKKNIDVEIAWILKAHKDSDGPFQSPETRIARQPGQGLPPAGVLIYKAVGALKVLMVNEECKNKLFLGEQNIIELMLSAYKYLSGKAPRDHFAQETCIACIQNFCNGPQLEQYCTKVFQGMGHLLVIRSMLQLEDNLEIQLAGCAAIWNMCLEKKKHRRKLKSLRIQGSSLESIKMKEITKCAVKPEESSQDEEKTLSSKERRIQLATYGAGSRAIAALIRFKEDSRVVQRAMGALKCLLQADEEELVKLIRHDVHEKKYSGVGVVNIFDVIVDAYEFHQETDPVIESFGIDLLKIFEIEDTEETNREAVAEMKKKEKVQNMTLTRMEKDGLQKKSVIVSESAKMEEVGTNDDSVEKLLMHQSLRHHFPESDEEDDEPPPLSPSMKKPSEQVGSSSNVLPTPKKTEGPSHKESEENLDDVFPDDGESESDMESDMPGL